MLYGESMKTKQELLNYRLLNKHSSRPISDKEFIKNANQIIQQCQIKLSIIKDEDVKTKLNNIIAAIYQIMQIIPEIQKNENDMKVSIKEHNSNLKFYALSLPPETQQRNTIASLSYSIAKACICILIFSFGIALGFMFQAWYFSYLSLKLMTDYLVVSLAAIGIPAVVMGAFAYGMHRTQKHYIKEFIDLQTDIADICEQIRAIENTEKINAQQSILPT